MTARVLETVLTGRNLLSPMLAKASTDVVAFNSAVARANGEASSAAAAAAARQESAAAKVAASNVKASTSATVSAQQQVRAHTRAAESATASSRVQQSANRALAASNGLLGTSLTPLTASLGAVALGMGYASYRGMEFGSAMSQVQAASQASAADMGRFRDAAVTAGADTQYSAVEAAQGITEMSKAGVSARDILGGGLTGALDLAAAGQIDVAAAAETGATALSVFRLEGSQMAHVADLLAAGAGKAQGSVGDLSAALNQSALVASQTGLSIEDTAGALAMFASNGLIGSDAGTSFKTMLQALTPNSKQAALAMDAIGFSAYDAQGRFVGMESVAQQLREGLAGLTEEQRNTTLETIFGSDAVRAASVLYKEGAQGVSEWTNKVNDAGYAQRQAAQLTDNLAGDLERLGGSVDTFFTNLGEGTQGALRLAVQTLTDLVNVGGDIVGFFTSLPGPVQAGVLALGALALLRGPLDGMLTSLAGKITGAATGMGMAVVNAGGFKGALGSLIGAINPMTAALTAATIGISYYMQQTAEVDARLQAAADAGDQFRTSLAEQRGEMNATSRAAADLAIKAAGLTEALSSIPGRQVEEAMTGNREAFDRTIASLEKYDQQQTVTSNGIGNLGIGLDVLTGKATENADAFRELTGQTGDYFLLVGNVDAGGWGRAMTEQKEATAAATKQTEEATRAQEEWLQQLQQVGEGFVEPLSIYQGLLSQKQEAERRSAEATAASTKSSSDSWRDYAGDVTVSLGDVATELQKQLDAQDNWRVNIGKIAQWAGADVAQYLAAMGKDGVQIVAQMADGTSAEAQRMREQILRDIQNGSGDWAASMDQGMKVLQEIGAEGGAATALAVAQKLGLGLADVRAIAAKYNVELATGLEPLLAALGSRTIALRARGEGMANNANYAEGGYTGDGGKYDPAGVVHRGEYVITKERTAKLGVHRLENLERILPGYASGGFVTPADVPRPPSTSPYGPPISTAGDAAMDVAYQETTNWLKANGPFGAALSWAKSQVGKPYIWGGVGPEGYDCSGFMSAITNVLRGRNPHSRVGATGNFPWPGFAPGEGAFTIGSTPNAGDGIGHMAGTLMGVNVESRGGQGVVVGGQARGASNSLFGTRAHLAMYGGGVITEPVVGIGARSGNSYSFGERGPEMVTPVPAAMPGYGTATSPNGGVSPVITPTVNIVGAKITGTFEIGGDGLARIIDGRVEGAIVAGGVVAGYGRQG